MLQQSKRECTFWESGSQAKIDFLIHREGDSIPVEIKVDENTRSKSVSIFREKHDIPYSIKLSTRNFDFRKNVKYLPVYAAFCIDTNNF
jgi:predicted AAA+ superfamily ATPase